MVNGRSHPFPPMIRIVHMYDRVADVLNNIKDLSQVTPDILKKLAGMEKDLTTIYQRLSPKLHFNTTNFQHYVKTEQGTNFILLHFWFHTLIILLRQPTLLHSFEGRIQQLFPGSRELYMSSTKTSADILAFTELIDIKGFIGNPFTSQPIWSHSLNRTLFYHTRLAKEHSTQYVHEWASIKSSQSHTARGLVAKWHRKLSSADP
ncbi:hypothetical protein DV736_g2572, partial [Chaetothyriales sp. CBS 134916]